MNLRASMLQMASALVAVCVQPASSEILDEVKVAYFLEWPLPFLAAKASGAYDEALGVTVTWISFETGTAMGEALASGDVQLAVSQGLPPFVAGVSAGQNLQVVDIAALYADHENCVIRADSGIDATNAQDLAGKKASVPLGTAAHYSFLRQMAHFGVDPASIEIVDMAPPEGAVALSHGAVDLACGYGGGLARMLEHGDVLLSGPEKAALGIQVFDVTSAPVSFVSEYSELVAAFLAVTAAANTQWVEAQSEEMLAAIAQQSGMPVDEARAALDGFEFPTIEQQLSAAWLGSTTVEFMKDMADVFVSAGYIDAALPSYDQAVNVGPLQAAADF